MEETYYRDAFWESRAQEALSWPLSMDACLVLGKDVLSSAEAQWTCDSALNRELVCHINSRLLIETWVIIYTFQLF